MNSASIDLIYLDPPFHSNANYAAPIGGEAADAAFKDTWGLNDINLAWHGEIKHEQEGLYALLQATRQVHGDSMMSFLIYMAIRIMEMRRLLKSTGSVYLHCDPNTGHYLKLLMDSVFGKANFRNEIVWQKNAKNNAAKKFGSVHDTIFAYAASATSGFNPQRAPYSKEYINKTFRHNEDGEPYTLDGLRDNTAGMAYEYKGRVGKWWVSLDGMKKLDAQGLLVFPENGKTIYRKRHLRDAKGRLVSDIWTDCFLGPNAKERLGYTTQKPLALLKRIIEASSNEGDIVLDPFCDCGTTIDAARRLKRSWVGIDISPFAIDLVRRVRLKDASISVKGVPTDIATAREMAAQRPFEFERWALSRIPGIAPNRKQVGDGGIDGRGFLLHPLEETKNQLVLAQVKGGQFSLSQFRDFARVVQHKNAAMGIYVTLDKPNSRDAYAMAAEMGRVHAGASEYPRMQIWPIANHFENRRPEIPPLADPVTGKAMHLDLFAG